MHSIRSRSPYLALCLLLFATSLGAAEPVLVADLEPGSRAGGSQPSSFTTVGDRVFFTAREASTGREVYATDGTAEGTVLLADICPGRCDSDPEVVATTSDHIVWWSERKGRLLISDGSVEGTVDLTPQQAVGRPAWFSGEIYFTRGDELFVTAATPGSTPRSLSIGLADRSIRIFAATGDHLYLLVGDPGRWPDELWVTEGTAAGTFRLGKFDGVDLVAIWNDWLFFLTNSGPGGPNLWLSDGTSGGTRLLAELPDHPDDYVRAEGPLLTLKVDDEIWVSDGTVAGTRSFARTGDIAVWGLLGSFGPDPRVVVHGKRDRGDRHSVFSFSENGSPVDVLPSGVRPTSASATVRLGDEVVIGATRGGDEKGEVWVTDGTLGGTSPVLRNQESQPFLWGPVGADVPFTLGRRLWLTNGTSAGTRPITAESSTLHVYGPVARLGSGYLFVADGPDTGSEPWYTDGSGSPGSSRLVKELYRTGDGAVPRQLTPTRRGLVFTVGGGHDPATWWVSPPAEPRMIVPAGDCMPELHFTDGDPIHFACEWRRSLVSHLDSVTGVRSDFGEIPRVVEAAALGASLYFFTGPDQASGPTEIPLWRADAGGLVRLFDLTLPLGLRADSLSHLTAVDGLLYFLLGDRERQLWRTDGTPGGTWPLTEPARVTPSGGPSGKAMHRLGDRLYFVGKDLSHGAELWSSAGGVEDAELTLDLVPGPEGSNPHSLLVDQGSLYLLGYTAGGLGLVRTDGTAEGTTVLALLSSQSDPPELVAAAERIFFPVDDGVHGSELWVSDGTVEGTRMLLDLYPGRLGSNPRALLSVGDLLYFVARSPAGGEELWRSDGTAAGTVQVADLAPGPRSSAPLELALGGDGSLYFSADDGIHGYELWRLDDPAPAGEESPPPGPGPDPRPDPGPSPPPPAGAWLATPELPGFSFKIELSGGSGPPRSGVAAASCIAETLCVEGAVPGRSEVFLRVVGPKRNGRLWPTLVKLSTARVDVWVRQDATGEVRHYRLAGAAPGRDELPGLFDRDGFLPAPAASGLVGGGTTIPAPARQVAPDEWFRHPAFPGYRFRVAITGQDGALQGAAVENRCLPETVCLSGAVPGRSELFLRLVGPKANGYLWPTLVRFTTSTVEVWIEQTRTGLVRRYRLPGAEPGSSELTGLFDREGFLP